MKPIHWVWAILVVGLGSLGFWQWNPSPTPGQERTVELQVAEPAAEQPEAPVADLAAPASVRRSEAAAPGVQAIVPRPLEADGPPQSEGKVEDRAELGTSGRGITLVAHLIEFTGKPLAERSVQLRQVPLARLPGSSLPMSFELTTDREGRIQLRLMSVRGQTFDFEFTDPSTSAHVLVAQVELPLQGTLDLGTLTLAETRELYPVALLSGRVIGDGGEVIPGALGTLSPSAVDPLSIDAWPKSIQGQVRIDDQGYFEAFGPPGVPSVDLTFLAPGYEPESVMQQTVPTSGMEIRVARTLRWSGRLLVPDPGPTPDLYGVWIGQKGGGFGITPGQDGSFLAYGTTRALTLKVSYPTLGVILFEREFVLEQVAGGKVGDIDLRDLVQVYRVQVVGGDMAPLGQELEFSGVGIETILGSTKTDGQGYLWLVLPAAIKTIQIGKLGEPGTTWDLSHLPAVLEIP
ncbi:MAG: hypothetical protein H6830_02660 [Planctomycetes bacterium]|nr:hypothetical protein [Planctomycetota bacterium]MCB9910156.1 hypothetical protein [Planctomycetota bacterium]